jgi:hypothetical protein
MPDSLVDPRVGRTKRNWGIVLMVLAAFTLIGLVTDFDIGELMTAFLLGGGGALLWRGAEKDRALARQGVLGQLQLQVLALAREDGRLTVTEVATRLGWPMERAETVLDSLEDGLRICSTPTDDGVIVYEFRELIHDPDRPQLPSRPPTLPRAQPGQ